MTDFTPSSDETSVAALLAQRSRADRNELLDELVSVLSAVIPGVQVERTLLRRRITTLRMPVGGYLYVLRKSAAGSFEPSRQQEVRGVVVRTVPMEIDAFLAELGVAVEAELRRTEEGRTALHKWLNTSNR
jgi:hypothetical protein